MKKRILLVLLLLLIPSFVSAKEIILKGTVSSNVKVEIDEIIVSLEDYYEEEGIKEYSLYEKDNYYYDAKDFRDSEAIKFVDGTVKVNGKIDAIERYKVECTNIKEENGIYYVYVLVSDNTITTTTRAEVKEEEPKNNNFQTIISYAIIGIVIIFILIFLLIFMIKAIRASNLY